MHEGRKQDLLLGLCGIRTQSQVIWLQILTTNNHAGFHVHPKLKYLLPKQTGRRHVSNSEVALGHALMVHSCGEKVCAGERVQSRRLTIDLSKWLPILLKVPQFLPYLSLSPKYEPL